MKTKDFLKKHRACADGAKWALSMSDDMADVWDAMLSQEKWGWLIWTLSRPGVFPEAVLLKMACRFVRETPLMDGLVVWDLLTDERSRKAVEVTEAYADGKATDDELRAARVSADAAYSTASRAADAAAYATARAAYAAGDAAYAAAKSAQVRMIAELGNPFK